VCDAESGCAVELVENETTCDDDGLACEGSWCKSGECVSVPACDDGLSCTADSCTADGCEFALIEETCFVDGVCFAPNEGDAANPCVICNPEEATDELSPAEDGTSCALEPCGATT